MKTGKGLFRKGGKYTQKRKEGGVKIIIRTSENIIRNYTINYIFKKCIIHGILCIIYIYSLNKHFSFTSNNQRPPSRNPNTRLSSLLSCWPGL